MDNYTDRLAKQKKLSKSILDSSKHDEKNKVRDRKSPGRGHATNRIVMEGVT